MQIHIKIAAAINYFQHKIDTSKDTKLLSLNKSLIKSLNHENPKKFNSLLNIKSKSLNLNV